MMDGIGHCFDDAFIKASLKLICKTTFIFFQQRATLNTFGQHAGREAPMFYVVAIRGDVTGEPNRFVKADLRKNFVHPMIDWAGTLERLCIGGARHGAVNFGANH